MKYTAIDRQRQIYLNGVTGTVPVVPQDAARLEQALKARLQPEAYAYLTGGAGQGSTMRNNRKAFERWRIIPRMLRNVEQRDTTTTLLGMQLPAPMLLAPIGVLDLAHPDADLAVARACSNMGIPYIFSNQASNTMEACAAQMSDTPRWFQLYWSKHDELVQSFVSRAENCGCTALVVTLDTTMLGWRVQDLDLGYLPFLRGRGIAQYTADPVFLSLLDDYIPESATRRITREAVDVLLEALRNFPGHSLLAKLRSGKPLKAVQLFIDIYSRPSLTWDDLAKLRQMTQLPILLKGILHPADAQLALDYGMDGIIVSNHGGRQVEGAIATLDALPPIAKVINKRIPILLDSGVRSGSDIFKALALGADAVCLGRPYTYGLALGGQEGVEEVLQNFVADFELTLGLAGCASLADIRSDMLVSVADY
jgi:lactate 2-monooxygenase